MRVKALEMIWATYKGLDDDDFGEAKAVMHRLIDSPDGDLDDTVATELYVSGKWCPGWQMMLPSARAIMTYFPRTDDDGEYLEMWWPLDTDWVTYDE